MSDGSQAWQEQLITIAVATTDETISSLVQDGERWFLNRISVRNRTRQNSDVIVSLRRAGVDLILTEIQNLGDDIWSTFKAEDWVYGGQAVVVSWSDVQASDVLEVHISGRKRIERQRSKPSPIAG